MITAHSIRDTCLFRNILVLVLFLLALPGVLRAQEGVPERVQPLKEPLDNLVQGQLYSPNYFPITGTPFLTEDWTAETVYILENEYQDLPVWYDLYADDLILLNQQDKRLHFIRLNQEHIRSFSQGSRRFINLDYSAFRGLELLPGFYELFFEGEASLLVKRAVEVLEENETLQQYFERQDRWYFIKDGQVFQIRNKRSLLSVLDKTTRKQIKAFLKKQKIRFRRIAEGEWRELMTYLNGLQAENS